MKERLDAAIVARGLVSGRDRAKAIIMAGQVFVDITDPGRRVVADESGEAVFERGDGPAGVFVTEEQWNRFGGQ